MTGFRSRPGRRIGGWLGLAACSLAAPAWAASITVSSTAPSVGAFDVAQPLFNAPGGYNGSRDFTDKNGPGQTFTTPVTVAGIILNSITVKGVGTGSGAAGGGFNTGDWHIRVSQVNAATGTLTSLRQEAADASVIPDDGQYLQYITFVFDTPVPLAGNTLYGFDIYSDNGKFALAKAASADPYAGGALFNTGADQSFSGTHATFTAGEDRTFFASLTPVPEPALAVAVGLAGMGAGLVRWSRRKAAC